MMNCTDLLYASRRSLPVAFHHRFRAHSLSAARHINDCAGNVGGFLRQEPENRTSDLFRLTAPLHWDGRLHPLNTLWLAPFGMQPGIDEPRPDRIHANAFFGDFSGQTYRERFDSSLAGRIINVFSRRTVFCGPGRDVHNRPTMASVSS